MKLLYLCFVLFTKLNVRIMQDKKAFENPFDSNHRNHFPGYSPMFRIKKTGSPEVRSGNWIVSSTTITGCVPDGKPLYKPSTATKTGLISYALPSTYGRWCDVWT